MTIDLPEGITYGVLTKEKTDELWNKIKDFTVMFSDDIKNDRYAFYNHIWGENTVFLEFPDGFVLFNDIIEGLRARAHAVFWDSKLHDKTEKMKECMEWAFFQYDLHRLECFVPKFSIALRRWLCKRIGFMQEGVLRNYFWYKGRLHDRIMLSITREEVFNGRK